MKERIKKIRRIIAEFIYPIDSVELIRRMVGSVEFAPLTGLTEEDRIAMLADADQVFKHRSFKFVINELINRQMIRTNLDAKNWESILICRGTINGFDLIEQEFQSLSSEYEARHKAEKYDEYGLIAI